MTHIHFEKDTIVSLTSPNASIFEQQLNLVKKKTFDESILDTQYLLFALKSACYNSFQDSEWPQTKQMQYSAQLPCRYWGGFNPCNTSCTYCLWVSQHYNMKREGVLNELQYLSHTLLSCIAQLFLVTKEIFQHFYN